MTPDAAADIEVAARETAALLLTASRSLSALADVIARAMDPGLRGGVWAKPVDEMATHAGDDEPASHPFAARVPAAAPAVDDECFDGCHCYGCRTRRATKLPVPDVHVAVIPESIEEAPRDDGGPEHVKRVFDGIADLRDKIGEALAADDAKRTRKPAAPWEPPGRVKITLAGLGIDAAAMLPRYREATASEVVPTRGREAHFRAWCKRTEHNDRGQERP